MSLFAGLDGGASKSRVRVVDAAGRVVGEAVAGPGSLTLGPDIAAGNVREALERALAGSGHGLEACRLVCALAGHRQQARCVAFEHMLQDIGSIEVIADGYAALLGAHGGKPGAIVILGTGSVGLSLDGDRRVHQIGGWGPVAGDEGGGNWLGRRLVRATLRAIDTLPADEEAMSPLMKSVYRKMGGGHEAVLDWLADADATRFAALVPLISSHEREGDPTAGRLLDDAAREAGRLIRLIGREGQLPVSLVGGLVDTLQPRLAPDTRSLLVPAAADPMDGALLRARELAPPEIYAA